MSLKYSMIRNSKQEIGVRELRHFGDFLFLFCWGRNLDLNVKGQSR